MFNIQVFGRRPSGSFLYAAYDGSDSAFCADMSWEDLENNIEKVVSISTHNYTVECRSDVSTLNLLSLLADDLHVYQYITGMPYSRRLCRCSRLNTGYIFSCEFSNIGVVWGEYRKLDYTDRLKLLDFYLTSKKDFIISDVKRLDGNYLLHDTFIRRSKRFQQSELFRNFCWEKGIQYYSNVPKAVPMTYLLSQGDTYVSYLMPAYRYPEYYKLRYGESNPLAIYGKDMFSEAVFCKGADENYIVCFPKLESSKIVENINSVSPSSGQENLYGDLSGISYSINGKCEDGSTMLVYYLSDNKRNE